MKLILVDWVDSRGGYPSWRRVEEISGEAPCVMQSVGWVISDTKEHIHLAAHIGVEDDGDHQCCGAMVIPRCAVKRTKVLKV